MECSHREDLRDTNWAGWRCAITGREVGARCPRQETMCPARLGLRVAVGLLDIRKLDLPSTDRAEVKEIGEWIGGEDGRELAEAEGLQWRPTRMERRLQHQRDAQQARYERMTPGEREVQLEAMRAGRWGKK